jgi:hypothetical protein
VTEEEAKTKWCPFARGMNDNGGNRIAYGSADDGPVEDDYTTDAAMKFPCIGSACMAFRRETTLQYDIAKEQPSGDGWRASSGALWPWVREIDMNRVFCGLAGKP